MIKNFILLTGPDDFRLSQKKHFYLKAFRQKFTDGEIEFLEEKSAFSDFENAVLTPNLFASKRLVVTEGFWNPDNFEAASKAEIFDKLPTVEDQVTVISIEPSLDKRTKAAKSLLKTAKTETFELLEEAQLIDWIIKFTEAEGGKISMSDARALLNRCGENGWNLAQEIRKCLMATDTKVIDKNLIETFTLPHPKVVIWDFLSALSQQRTQAAIVKFRELRMMGEAPHMIFAMIIREIRIHTQIQAGLQENLSAKEIASHFGIHPFVVQKTMPLSRSFSLPKLKNLYDELLTIDKKLKTGGLSLSTDDQGEFELVLEKFIIKSC